MARLRDFTRQLCDKRFNANESALARAMGVSQSTVHRFLAGKTIGLDVIKKIARVAGVNLTTLLDGEPSLPENDLGLVPSPAPPPVSETRVIDDRVKELLDEAWDSDEHEPSDALLVGEVLSANAALVRPDVEPVDLVRALLDTAAEARAKGKKISAQDLPAIALVSTKRQLLDAERRLQEFLARAKAEAEMLGVETRNTPHPALLRAREKMHGIPANKRKKAPKLCSGQ